MCENHKSDHTNHRLSEIPGTYLSDGRMNITKIDDVLFNTQNYISCSSFQQFGLFKYEVADVPLPDDYKEGIRKMIHFLIHHLIDTTRGNDERVRSLVADFFNSIPKIIMNFEFNVEKEQEIVLDFFNKMHSRISDDVREYFTDVIQCMVSNSILQEVKTTLGIVTGRLNTQDEKFWNNILIGKFNIDSIIKVFRNRFEQFAVKKEEFQNIISKFEFDLIDREKKITESIKEELFTYFSEKFMNTFYVQFIFYQSISNPNLKTQQVFKPEFFAIENRIFKKESIKITSVIQSSIGIYIFLIVFENSNKSCLVELKDSKLNSILIFHSSSLIILPGSSPEKLLILQNYPRKLYCFQIYDGSVLGDDNQAFTGQTESNIISAAYMTWEDSIIFCTSSNNLLVKSFDQASEQLTKVDLNLEKNENILEVNVKPSKRMIVVHTSRALIILNYQYKEVYRIKAREKKIEAFDELNSNSVFFFLIVGKLFLSCEIIISLNDQKEIFKFEHEKENRFRFTLKGLKTMFKSPIIDKEDDSYIKQFNLHFAPMAISHAGAKVIEPRNEEIDELLSLNQAFDVSHPVIPQPEPSPVQERIIAHHSIPVQENIRLNPFLYDEKLPRFDMIQGKCKLCGKSCNSDEFLCHDEHSCQAICLEPGACSKYGKMLCCKKIPAGKDAHEGKHECESKFHSCGEACPVDECSIYCVRKYNHSNLHKCDIHVSKNGKSCNNVCFDRNHFHYIKCICSQVNEQACKMRSIKHCHEQNKDIVGCEDYWEFHKWEKFIT
jgi:hypothetical protein